MGWTSVPKGLLLPAHAQGTARVHRLRLRARIIQKFVARARRVAGVKVATRPKDVCESRPRVALQGLRTSSTQQLALHRVCVVMGRRGNSGRHRQCGAERLRVLRMTLAASRHCPKARGQHRLRPTPRGAARRLSVGAARRREAAPGHYLHRHSACPLQAAEP